MGNMEKKDAKPLEQEREDGERKEETHPYTGQQR